MLKFREGFETNSSSCHNLCVPKSEDIKLPDSIDVSTSSYGWEYKGYSSPNEILSYIYTALLYEFTYDNINIDKNKDELNSYLFKIEDALSPCKINWIPPQRDSNRYLDDYIDHCKEAVDIIYELLEDTEGFRRFVSHGMIFTGNDNGGSMPALPSRSQDYTIFVKKN